MDYGCDLQFKDFKNLPGIVVAFGKDARVAYSSKGFDDLPESSGRPWIPGSGIAEANQKNILNACKEVIRTGKPLFFELGKAGRDSVTNWFKCAVNPLYGTDSSTHMAVANCVDVTEYRREELKLRHRFKLLTEAAKVTRVGIWEWEMGKPDVWWSDELYEIYGETRSTYSPTYEGYLKKIHGEDRERVAAALTKAVIEHQTFSHDERIVRPDGSVRYLHTWGHPTLDETGNLIGLTGVCQDISEMTIVAKHLRLSEERLRGVLEQGPFLVELRSVEGKIYNFEKGWAKLWGVEGEEVKSLPQAFDEVLTERGESDFVKRAFLGEVVRGDPFYFDPSTKQINGRGRWIESQYFPIKDEQGNVREIAALFFDVTSRMQLENKMRMAEKYQTLVFNTIDDVVFYVSLEANGGFRFKSVNNAFLQKTGLPFEKIAGKLVDEVIPEPSLSMVLCQYKSAVANKRSYSWDEITPYPSGTKYGEVTVTPVFSETGECTGLVGTVHDITERKNAESEAKKNLSMLRAIVDGTSDAVFVKDLFGKYVIINKAGAALLHQEPSQIVGKTDYEIMPIETALEFVRGDKEVVESGITHTFLESGMFGGMVRTFSAVKGPYRDSEGRIIGLIGISRDVTDTKTAKQNLEHSLSLVKATLESTAEGVMVVGLGGKITEYNKRLLELWKLPESLVKNRSYKEALGFVLDKLTHPEVCAKRLEEIVADPEMESFDVLDLIDGRVFERHSRPQKVDGKTIGRVFSYRDVTARERAEKSLRMLADASKTLSQARLELSGVEKSLAQWIAEYFSDGSIIRLLDENAKTAETVAFHHVNPETLALMKRILPYQRKFIDEESVNEVLKTGEPSLVSLRPEAAATRLGADFKEALKRFPVHSWLTVPLRIAGKIIGLVTVFRFRAAPPYSAEDTAFLQDLADRAALAIDNAQLFAEAQKAIVLREDFISIASHELRTPLTPLKLQAQLIQMVVEEDLGKPENLKKLKMLVNGASQQIDRVLTLSEDLLNVTRIGAGKLSLSPQSCDLVKIVNGAIAIFSEELKKKKVDIRVTGDASVTGEWDPQQIGRVATNLISNAVKYGAGKPVEVSVKKIDGHAEMRIKDKGIGIPFTDQKNLFRRFYRVAKVQHYGGLGLGLYVSKEIVNAHGGSINVESRDGDGAAFTVKIPMKVPSDKLH